MNIVYICICMFIFMYLYIHINVYLFITGDLFITNYSTEYTNYKNNKIWISVNNKKKYKKNTNIFELNLNEKNYFRFLFFNDKTLRHNHTPYGNVVQQSVFKSIYSFLGTLFFINLYTFIIHIIVVFILLFNFCHSFLVIFSRSVVFC
jgi:hypothetical protein